MATNKQLIVRWQNVLRVLRALTPHQRRKHWDMRTWGEVTECGTIACAAGHCGLDPWFRRRGLRLNTDIMVQSPFPDCNLSTFFGEEGFATIFLNTKRRSVGQVCREVRAHIKWLQSEGDTR